MKETLHLTINHHQSQSRKDEHLDQSPGFGGQGPGAKRPSRNANPVETVPPPASAPVRATSVTTPLFPTTLSAHSRSLSGSACDFLDIPFCPLSSIVVILSPPLSAWCTASRCLVDSISLVRSLLPRPSPRETKSLSLSCAQLTLRRPKLDHARDRNRHNLTLLSLYRAQHDHLDLFMPSYGSLHSPSLKKYNMNIMDSRRAKFNIGNIFGDPFALATISISLVG